MYLYVFIFYYNVLNVETHKGAVPECNTWWQKYSYSSLRKIRI